MMVDPVSLGDALVKASQGRIGSVEVGARVGRHEVDLLFPGVRLVVELGGAGTNGAAARDRYLQREGLTVIRFSQEEGTGPAERLVSEVAQVLRARDRHRPSENTVYVDWLFLTDQAMEWSSFYRDLYPGRISGPPPLSAVLRSAAEWLRLEGDYEVHTFAPPGVFEDGVVEVDTLKYIQYDGGVMALSEHQADLVVFGLTGHLKENGPHAGEVVLMADDPAYGPLLTRGGAQKPTKLLRKSNHETHMTELDDVVWQNVAYIMGTAMGLHPQEL